MQKIPLSVSIITYNEEENIFKTLDAIASIAEEIIIVDSGSTDQTRKIAESFGAKVFVESWKGYVNQKNFALSKCTNKWILALDSDEVVTPPLLISIVEAVQNDDRVAYKLDRVTYYLGKKMMFAWRPDWKLRLVRRDCNPRWEGLDPHDELIADCPTKNLTGQLLHFPYKDLETHFLKTIKYSKLSARSYYEKGVKFRLYHLLINPIFSFIKIYFINLGFFDGIRGLIAGVSSAVSTFLKYSFLWELYLKKR